MQLPQSKSQQHHDSKYKSQIKASSHQICCLKLDKDEHKSKK